MKLSNAINFAFYFVAFFSNAFGFLLLWKVPDGPRFSATQRLYLLNISACEITTCLLYMVIRVLNLEENSTHSISIYKVTSSGLYFWYIGLMTLMTFDRFLVVYLNIRYPLIWSFKKTRFSLLLLFIVSVLVTIPFYVMDPLTLHFTVILYWWPILDTVFIVTCVATYSYFFSKIKKMRAQQHVLDTSIAKRPTTEAVSLENITQQQQQQQPAEQPKKKSPRRHNPKQILTKIKRGFFTPTLLIITFLIFWLIPDQLFFWDLFTIYYRLVDEPIFGDLFFEMIKSCYPFGFISDAVIYIFFQKEVFSYLKRKRSVLVKAR